jgi:uncharacterized protein (TIGR02145 family)
LWISPAFAESKYVDNWIGTWSVHMKDGSTATWDITHTWVSETGKSHIAYGIKHPGNVEFQIYFGTMFKKHSYIEISHKVHVYDLPMLFTKYTRLMPSDDFTSFTAKKGKYPIRNGMKGTNTLSPFAGTAKKQKPFPVNKEIIKTETPVFSPGEPLTDIAGNTYPTVRINDQVWMAENLETGTYANGAPIPCPGTDNTAWENNTDGAYSWHGNDVNNKGPYGALYNWAAVKNPNGLCPDGWHVPSDEEWQILVDYLGGDDLAGGTMKSTITDPAPHPRWSKPNIGATNSSGFNGLPAGLRRSNGTFREIGPYGAWWTATDGEKGDAWHRSIFFADTQVYHFVYGKGSGMSVRCIKD